MTVNRIHLVATPNHPITGRVGVVCAKFGFITIFLARKEEKSSTFASNQKIVLVILAGWSTL